MSSTAARPVAVRYFETSVPGLIDPSQKERLLRHPNATLQFATFDPNAATGTAPVGTQGRDTIRPAAHRIVFESVPGLRAPLSWRHVPPARLGSGVTHEGSFPRFVNLCGLLVIFSPEQWELYKLDPVYDCYVPPEPDCPIITRIDAAPAGDSVKAPRKRRAPSPDADDVPDSASSSRATKRKTTSGPKQSANASKSSSAKDKGKGNDKQTQEEDMISVPMSWFTDPAPTVPCPTQSASSSNGSAKNKGKAKAKQTQEEDMISVPASWFTEPAPTAPTTSSSSVLQASASEATGAQVHPSGSSTLSTSSRTQGTAQPGAQARVSSKNATANTVPFATDNFHPTQETGTAVPPVAQSRIQIDSSARPATHASVQPSTSVLAAAGKTHAPRGQPEVIDLTMDDDVEEPVAAPSKRKGTAESSDEQPPLDGYPTKRPRLKGEFGSQPKREAEGTQDASDGFPNKRVKLEPPHSSKKQGSPTKTGTPTKQERVARNRQLRQEERAKQKQAWEQHQWDELYAQAAAASQPSLPSVTALMKDFATAAAAVSSGPPVAEFLDYFAAYATVAAGYTALPNGPAAADLIADFTRNAAAAAAADRMAAIEESRRKLAELDRDPPLVRAQAIRSEAARQRALEEEERRRNDPELQRQYQEALAAAEWERAERRRRDALEERRERQRARWAGRPWSSVEALQRYIVMVEEFDHTRFTRDHPADFEFIPWPVLYHPNAIGIEDITWLAIEAFFAVAMDKLTAEDYMKLVESSQRRFHPDRLRARGILNSVEDDEYRIALEKAGNTITQVLTPTWQRLKARQRQPATGRQAMV